MPVRRPWQAALAAAGVLALLAGRGAQAQEVAPAPCAGKELETTDLPGAEGTDCAGMKAANQCGEAWMKDGGYCTCTCGGSAGAEDGGGGSAGAAPAPVGAACKGTELETTTLPGNDNKLDCAGMKGAGLCGADWMVRRNSPPAAEPLRPSATDPTPAHFCRWRAGTATARAEGREAWSRRRGSRTGSSGSEPRSASVAGFSRRLRSSAWTACGRRTRASAP